MANLIIYKPNSITIPRELVERHINVLSAMHRVDFIDYIDDKYALIHDVFRTRDGTKIIALDSAWHKRRDKMLRTVNGDGRGKITELSAELSQLLDEVWPLKVFHCGKPLKYKYQRLLSHTHQAKDERSVVGIYEISLSHDLRSKSIIELDFVFGNGNLSRKLQIPRNPFVKLAKTPLVLHTLQKDNPLEWIEDWCKYYYREHGVKRIVIYDNGSVNHNKIAHCLKRIEDPIDLILTNWPFRYNTQFNKTQNVALNHALHILGDSSKYYLNFDIDEYLVNQNNLSLEQYLDDKDDGHRSHHLLKQRVVFAIETNGLPRVSDFQYVQKHCLLATTKTINIQGRVECASAHNTRGKLNGFLYIFSRVSVVLLERFPISSRHCHRFDKMIVRMNAMLSPVSLWTRWKYRCTHRA